MIGLLSKLFTQPNKLPPLPRITTKHPLTPAFFVDTQIVRNRLSQIQMALKKYRIKHNIAFSFKTNYDFAKSDFLQKSKLLAETVSHYEYSLATNLGFDTKNIILNGPNKGDLSKLIQTNSTIHLDNFVEINEIIRQKSTLFNAKIGIRLNTKVVTSRFGFNIENGEAKKAITILQENKINLDSLHLHLGSDIYEPQLYEKTAVIVAQFINQYNLKPKTIDFGGGFPAHGETPYGRNSKITPDISEYMSAISTLFRQISFSPKLILEPGRFLIDDATTFITKVINNVTTTANQQVITVDSSINMLPSLWYRPPTLQALDYKLLPINKKIVNTTIYGSSCQEHDILFRGKLPLVSISDYILFHHVGAYNQSMSSEFIFQKPITYFV